MTSQPQVGAEIVGAADSSRRYLLEEKRMSFDYGSLGRLFGSSANAPTNISGLLLFLLVLPGVLLVFLQGNIEVGEYFKLILPAVTLVAGFLFGRKS